MYCHRVVRTMNFTIIDGSYGEGGGQIVRTSVSLSAVTMRPVRIINIRSGRSNPGLRRQHIAGVELIARVVDAEVSGLEVGSTRLEFIPCSRHGGTFSYDIGTAGSISLVLQAVFPALALCPEPSELTLTGGTDVAWSPPIDYMVHVFGHTIRHLGVTVDTKVIRRGHYPRGGGTVRCRVWPTESIHPVHFDGFGNLQSIYGLSHCVRLPRHVAVRQAQAAAEVLQGTLSCPVQIETESYDRKSDPHLGPGSGIVLWAESGSGMRIGSDSLGTRGKPAEQVGREAATSLLSELSTGLAVDSHLCDMLVPYVAMASGVSRIGITRVTSHLKTNLWVTSRFLDADLSLEGSTGTPGLLTVRGVGLSVKE